MILFFEVFFIKTNIEKFNSLYSEVAKANLREDATLIKNLADKSTRKDFKEIFDQTNKRFTLIKTDGTVLFDSRKFGVEEILENHNTRPEIVEAMNGIDGFSIRKSETLDRYMAYYAVSYEGIDSEKFIIRTSRDYDKDREIVKKILSYQMIFFIILNMFVYYSYKNYLKRHLFKKVDKIRKTLEIGDEVSELYDQDDQWLVEFWKVIKEWQSENLENLRTIKLEKKRLKRIISSVDQSVMLIDKESKILLRNNALNFLYRTDKRNPYYMEVKFIEIIDLIKNCEETKEPVKEEVYIAELKKFMLVGIKYLEANEQYVVTIKDVTRSKEMLEVQRNFISNISHELKTPLTNIKGYLIALEDAPEEMKDYFIKVAKNNVDKLENIIMDFLNISKFENSKVVNISEVSFEKVRENVEAVLDTHISTKNAVVNYSINLLDENGFMRTDKDKLETVLKNLIENAIIYNDKEKPIVNIELLELYDCYKITVSDNGIGIAETEINNIFERFYRVDKARTSNIAGTGLGLAIVSEIIKSLGGKLEVESKEEVGTTFQFRILK